MSTRLNDGAPNAPIFGQRSRPRPLKNWSVSVAADPGRNECVRSLLRRCRVTEGRSTSQRVDHARSLLQHEADAWIATASVKGETSFGTAVPLLGKDRP